MALGGCRGALCRAAWQWSAAPRRAMGRRWLATADPVWYPHKALEDQLVALQSRGQWERLLRVLRLDAMDWAADDTGSGANPDGAASSDGERPPVWAVVPTVANLALRAARQLGRWDTFWHVYRAFLAHCRAALDCNGGPAHRPAAATFLLALKALAVCKGQGPVAVEDVLRDMQDFEVGLTEDSVPYLATLYHFLGKAQELDALFDAVTAPETLLLGPRAVAVFLVVYAEAADVRRLLTVIDVGARHGVLGASLVMPALAALRPICSPEEYVAALEALADGGGLPLPPAAVLPAFAMLQETARVDVMRRLLALAQRLHDCTLLPARSAWDFAAIHCAVALCHAHARQGPAAVAALQRCPAPPPLPAPLRL
eukprot:EG_transcript_17090